MTWRGASERRRGGDTGFTLVELLVVVAVIGAVTAIAVPGLLKARIAADEASAVGALRSVNAAQANFAGTVGQGRFAAKLASLATPCTETSQAFLSVDLARDPSIKSGYTIELQPAADTDAGPEDCHGASTYDGYYVTAVPVMAGISGRSAFASSSTAIVFVDPSGEVPTEADMKPGGDGTVVK